MDGDLAEASELQRRAQTAERRVRMEADERGCIEFWHEHRRAPGHTAAGVGPGGETTRWVRFVNLDDLVTCPYGDAVTFGDPTILIGRVEVNETKR